MGTKESNLLKVSDDRDREHLPSWARREQRRGCFGAELHKEIERREWAHRRFFRLKNTTIMAIGAGILVMPIFLKLVPVGWVSEDVIGDAVLLLILFGLLIVLAVGLAGRPKSIVVDALREKSLCPICVYTSRVRPWPTMGARCVRSAGRRGGWGRSGREE